MTTEHSHDAVSENSAATERHRRETPAAAKLWRRGPVPVPAGHSVDGNGAVDYGYQGPDSVAWRVLTETTVLNLEVAVTSVLQFARADMGANMIQHDPLLNAGMRGEATPDMVASRERRTIGVMIPAIFADKASANRIAAHVRGFHRSMQGIIPGTEIPYDATGPEMVLFGHVTIMQAALLIFERASHRDGNGGRLTEAERDRYWSDVAPFGVLMGAREADIPRTSAEVRAYHEACAGEYYNQSLILRSSARAFFDAIKPRKWRNPLEVAIVVLIGLTHFSALTMMPKPVRRNWGVPAAADPALDLAFRALRPGLRLLSGPRVGNRITAWLVGPDGFALIENARTLMAERAHAAGHAA